MSVTTHENNPRSDAEKQAQHDAHRDPLSGRAGAHPVGTAAGAAAGGAAGVVAAGAAIGTIAGPVGTVAGAAAGAIAGAIAGGLAGKAVAEHVNPTLEHAYWRENFVTRAYAHAGAAYDEYAPAFQYGWESQARHAGEEFAAAEATLKRDWEKAKGACKLSWDHAREAARDSWNRVSKPRSGH